jgi:ankyrin repeat protein
VRGDLHAVKLLVTLGLDVNGIGDLGNTPLHYAKRHGNQEIVDLLVECGADVYRENELGAVP